MNSYTFTIEEFQNFKAAVEHDLRLFEISGWNIEIVHEQIGDGTCAQIWFNIVSRNARIRLTHTVEYDYSLTSNVRVLARHEVLHLLFAELSWIASETRNHCSDAVTAKEHDIINRLIKALK